MSKKMKNWIHASRKFSSIRSSEGYEEEGNNHKPEMLSPDEIVKS